MDNVKLSKWFGLTITLMLQHEGSCILFGPVPLCEKSNVEIVCPNKTVITNLNITLPPSTDNFCTTYSTDDILYNETDVNRCLGNRACNLSSTVINFTDLPEQIWKLNVNYSCDKPGDSNPKCRKNFCPDKIKSVVTCSNRRKISIKSAYLETTNYKCLPRDEQKCAAIIEEGVKTMCDRNNPCDIIEGKTLNRNWNSCIRSPKYIYVSYVCSADFANNKIKDDSLSSTELLGIVVGIICGLMIVGIIGCVYIFQLKSNSQQFNLNKKNERQAHFINDVHDYIGQQSVAFHTGGDLVLPSRHGQSQKKEQSCEQTVNSYDKKQIWRDNEYEFAEPIVNDAQDDKQDWKQESKRPYVNFADSEEQNKDMSSNLTLRDTNEYSLSRNNFSEYDKICRSDVRRVDTSDHVYSHMVDDEYDTAQILKCITKNQNYDHVVLDG